MVVWVSALPACYVCGSVTPTDVVSEKARVCRYQSHSWGLVLGLSESEGREARRASVLLSDLLRSCSFLGPCRRLSAQPPQGFKIIVKGLYNFDRVIGPFRFNYPLTVAAT